MDSNGTKWKGIVEFCPKWVKWNGPSADPVERNGNEPYLKYPAFTVTHKFLFEYFHKASGL